MADASIQELMEVKGHRVLITGTKYVTGDEGDGGFGSDKQWGWIKRFDFYNTTSGLGKKREGLYYLGYTENLTQMLDGMSRIGEEVHNALSSLDGLPVEDRQKVESKIELVAERQLKINPGERKLLPDEMDIESYNVLVGQKLLQKVFGK